MYFCPTGGDFPIYNLAFLTRQISNYDIWFTRRYFLIYFVEPFLVRSVTVSGLCWFLSCLSCLDVIYLAHLPMDVWCCVIVPLNVSRFGKFWAARFYYYYFYYYYYYYLIVYSTQVNSAFGARWLARSEMIKQLYSPPSFDHFPVIIDKVVFGTFFQHLRYRLKQLCGRYLPF